MAINRQCATCGAVLTEHASAGQCPQCLIQLGLAASGPVSCDSASEHLGGLPRQFGDYELLEEIARGGMGVVFKARQKSLDRLVAVKLILSGHFAGQDSIHRFRTEASAAAALQHPNIVAIHEVGVHQGEHYLVMDLVEGSNLAQFTKIGPLPADRAARYLKTIAEAIHYAHQRGILHRDLKPSNVLIDPNNQPRVTDFGLAKRLTPTSDVAPHTSDLTLTGQVLGSPNYVPPEQASGKRGVITARSDIYSLGAILYHLITGRAPFVSESIADTLHLVLHEEPPLPRLLNRSVPCDLETICLKCLEKEPARRYAAARELAEDLGRFLREEPIHARPVGRTERIWRWSLRRPMLAGAIAITTAALSVAVLFAVAAWRAENKRLKQWRQSSIEKTLLLAWSGDFTAADLTLREAEFRGATAGETRILRGQLAFHRGEFEEAASELQQAVRLQPDNVTAHAMLMVALNRLGRWEAAAAEFQLLPSLQARTAEDYLFKGMAEAELDPERGLATVDEGTRLRSTGLSHLVRARVRFLKATFTGDPIDATGAAEDAEFAKRLLPGSVIPIATSLLANIAAANAYAEAGQHEQQAVAQKRARIDAIALQAFTNNQQAVIARFHYLNFMGEDGSARNELEAFRMVTKGLQVDSIYGLTLFQIGQITAAHRVMGNSAALKYDADFLYILAELPEGPERVVRQFEEAWERGFSAADWANQLSALRLLGRNAEADIKCKSLGRLPAFLESWRHGWNRHLFEYNCGAMTDENFLELAGQSRWNQCEANFHIAVRHLGNADRRSAREHFQKVLATRSFHHFEFLWSRAFLARMEKDPNWPPWIPNESAASR